MIFTILQEKYGKGELSDEMIDAMVKDMGQYDYNRIIAFGGGTIVDICKILALEPAERSEDLFTGKKEPKKVKELIVVLFFSDIAGGISLYGPIPVCFLSDTKGDDTSMPGTQRL